MVVKQQRDIQGAISAADRTVEVHQHLIEYLRPGLTLPEIDGFVARTLDDLKCKSAFHKYKLRGHPPFPSQACLSVNSCVVHGTHNMKQPPLQPGDVISIDIGVKHRGWVGDAGWTYAIEHQTPRVEKLMTATREALRIGIEAMQPGGILLDWASAVQPAIESAGFHCVQGLGGHGYGKRLHGPPYVANTVPNHPTEWEDATEELRPGQLLAVELMIGEGTDEVVSYGKDWPIFTADDSLSVHYECDILVADDEVRNLTKGMFDLPAVVGG